MSDITWNDFCGAADAHRRELEIIKRRMERDNAKIAQALRTYYEQHRVTLCAPGTEFVVKSDRTLEVKP